jgi:perosamine synthetase
MVIEDAAEAIGLEIDGKPCGSFGDVSTMSFYANKHITTGEGGIVLTNSTKIEERSKYLRNLCFDSERRFKHDEIGWNYRMSGLQAAFGLGQIMNLRETIQRKTEIGALYQELFSTETRFLKPVEKSLGSNNIYWVFAVVLDPSLGLLASTVIDQMHKQGVGCRPFFFPMHKQPVFINDGLFEGEHYPVAETLSDFGLYLPSGTSTTNEQIRFSAEILIKTLDSLDV